MAVSDLAGLIIEVGEIALWLKAAGIAALVWIIFESILIFFNLRRLRQITHIRDDMKRMESKLDRLLKRK